MIFQNRASFTPSLLPEFFSPRYKKIKTDLAELFPASTPKMYADHSWCNGDVAPEEPALLLGIFPQSLSLYNFHMRYARVGDAVWYRGGELQEKAEILAFEKAATEAVVLILTGPQRGQTPDAPKATLEPLVIRETDGEYDIEVRVRVAKGFFTDRGFIRKSNLAGALTFEISFESGERHPSAEAALDAGMAFAREKIDEMWAVD